MNVKRWQGASILFAVFLAPFIVVSILTFTVMILLTLFTVSAVIVFYILSMAVQHEISPTCQASKLYPQLEKCESTEIVFYLKPSGIPEKEYPVCEECFKKIC